MKDIDSQLIFEAFEGGVRRHEPTGEWESLVDYLIQKGHEEIEAKELANGFLKYRGKQSDPEIVNTYEIKILWANSRGGKNGSTMTMQGSNEPSEEEAREYVQGQIDALWSTPGEILNNDLKSEVIDPNEFTIDNMFPIGDDEDHNSVTGRIGGKTLYGG